MIKQLLEKNRSYRGYAPCQGIEREELLDMVETVCLSPSAKNMQPLKYRLVYGEEAKKLHGLYTLGGFLPELKLPYEGTEPEAFVVVCLDTNLSSENKFLLMEVGIMSHSILLRATEMGYGGIMVGAARFKEIGRVLNLPENLTPQLLLAIGKPMEDIHLKKISKEDDRKYYREKGKHMVPKVALEDLIL